MPPPQGVSWFTNFLRQDNSWQDPITNNLNTNNPNYPYSSTFLALFIAFGTAFWNTLISTLGFGRILLTAPTTFFWGPGGSDGNTGTSSGSPWATMAPLSNKYDVGGQTVTLKLTNDTNTQFVLNSWVGGGQVVVDLQRHTIASTLGAAFVANYVGTATIKNGKLSSSNNVGNSGQAIDCLHTGILYLAGTVTGGDFLEFGSCLGAHMRLRSPGGSLIATFPDFSGGAIYKISGGGVAHFQLSEGFANFEQAQAQIIAAVSFSDAYHSMFSGISFWGGYSFTGGGNVTNTNQYNIRLPASAKETSSLTWPGTVPGAANLWNPLALT